MNPNLKGVYERNEAASAMLASIHEYREKDWAKYLETGKVALCLVAGKAAIPEDMQREFEELVPLLKDAFEKAWMNGVPISTRSWPRSASRK
jgi:hypothetical protein